MQKKCNNGAHNHNSVYFFAILVIEIFVQNRRNLMLICASFFLFKNLYLTYEDYCEDFIKLISNDSVKKYREKIQR